MSTLMPTKLKKAGSILVRVEEDVEAFYKEESERRRVSVAHIVRELLYKDMAAKTKSKNQEDGNGVL